MSNKALLRIGALGCAVALVAGCGASSPKAAPTAGGTPAGPTTSPTSPASTPTATPAATPASLATLKKIVLQPADLPAGWKGTPYQPDPSSAADDAAMSRCMGARNTDKDKVAEADSEDFSLSNASISSSASSFRSQSDLDTDIAVLHNPKMSTCFKQMMGKKLTGSLPHGATIASASFKVTPGSAGGPANVVATAQGTIDVTLSGQHIPIYLTVAFITGPLIEAEIDTENVGSPVPASVLNPLIAKVAARAAQG